MCVCVLSIHVSDKMLIFNALNNKINIDRRHMRNKGNKKLAFKAGKIGEKIGGKQKITL